MVVLGSVDFNDVLTGGAAAAGLISILLGWRLAEYRTSKTAEAATKAQATAEALRAGLAGGATGLSDEEKQKLASAAEEAEKLLQALPENDRLPGLLVLSGVALFVLALAAAGLIDISFSSNADGSPAGAS
jgi:hypothetical protein